jgi:RNA polymerase sigma-70 factor (ECF subfamily)
MPITAHDQEPARLEAARGGDQDAFGRLVEPYRRELHAHCYRMLGSVHDAEDAMQETLLRAWRGLARFEGRSAFRSWLYTVATNTCLNHIARRPKRVLPVDYGPATDPHAGPGEPVVETLWVEPYPDEAVSLGDETSAPDASYELRESIELAFIVALQQLPATQRAVLILREVLGFSAAEVAEALGTTVASVNSALQRARKAVAERTPEQSQQATLRSIGDEDLRELVTTYVDAWERNDVDTVVAMLAEDATFAMPPLASWFGPLPEIREFLAGFPLSGMWRWRAMPTRANGQIALGFYAWDEATGTHLPFALNVLTLRGREITDVVAFSVRAIEAEARERYHRWVDEPIVESRRMVNFEAFGLPARVD